MLFKTLTCNNQFSFRKITIMKKLFILVCLASLIISCNVYAQSVNTEKGQIDPVIAVEASAMNVFYAGVGNPIQIACSGISSSDLQVAITNGKIKGSDGKYSISPGQSGTMDLKIMHKGELLGIKQFRVLNLPEPIANIILMSEETEKHINSGFVTIGQLVNSLGLTATLTDFLFDVEFKIVGFNINVEQVDGILTIVQSESDKFTSEQKKVLRSLKSGHRVLIEDIQALGPDGITRNLNSITLKIE